MPLPFLTIDGVHEDHSEHAEPAGARRAEVGWHRPYRLGPARVGMVALLLVLTSYLLIAALVEELAGSASGAVVLAGAAVLLVALGLRMLRVGVWVGPAGLRQVTLTRTTTLGRNAIGSVRTAQQPVRWLSLPRTVQGQALVVRRADGTELRTLLSDHSPDFLGRSEGFDVAADFIEAWAAPRR